MSSRSLRRSSHKEEEESYFISMADMMVGLLFIFIILLLFFALQYKQALSGAADARSEILNLVAEEIRQRDPTIKVTVVENSGVLRLPDNVLFASAEYELSGGGEISVGVIAEAMGKVLPCYTLNPPANGCRNVSHRIDAIFIEGHTDSVPLRGNATIQDNLDLSALRATHTFRAMLKAQPSLDQLLNSGNKKILSVSGYGDRRNIAGNDTEEQKGQNRRIDLRFLMETPPLVGMSDILVDVQ